MNNMQSEIKNKTKKAKKTTELIFNNKEFFTRGVPMVISLEVNSVSKRFNFEV